MQRTLLVTMLCTCLTLAAWAQADEEAAVKKVVTTAYVEGIQNRGPIADIRQGFHPSFAMLRLVDNTVKPLPIEEWITNMEKFRKENPPTAVRTEATFVQVAITGSAAMVTLELAREGKKTFTDYIALYKFTEGWRIVSKTFYRHP